MGDPATPLGMTRDLTRRLAALHDASAGASEAAIAVWKLGDRISLFAHGIIDTKPDESLAQQGMPTDFALTDYGLEVIADCASWKSHGGRIPA